MVSIDLQELKVQLEEKLEKQLMSAKILLGHCRFIDEKSRQTSAYSDPRYLPFYYYLGSLIQPATMVEVGLRLGLTAACFYRSCKSVDQYLAIQESVNGEFYSPRLAKANIRDHYKGKLDLCVGTIADNSLLRVLDSRKWDLAIIDDEVAYDRHMAYLDVLWDRMTIDGLIVVDHLQRHEPAKQSFLDFARVRNREPVILNTRYSVGMIQR